MKSLKTYLTINSLFSFATGLILVIFSEFMLTFFNIIEKNGSLIFNIIGLSLIVFSGFVWYVSAKQLENIGLIKLISFLDITWVLGSVIIVFFQFFNLSNPGYILTTVVAVWISFLAYKQLKSIM